MAESEYTHKHLPKVATTKQINTHPNFQQQKKNK